MPVHRCLVLALATAGFVAVVWIVHLAESSRSDLEKLQAQIDLARQWARFNVEQQRALMLIDRLGGRVETDPEQQGTPVVGIFLRRIGSDGEGLKCLQCFPRLHYLGLQNYKESEDLLIHLRNLTQVKWLALDGPSISNTSMQYVGALKNLEHLSVASSVDDRGLEYIQGLSGLRKLEVERTGVSDKGMASLKFWKKLTTLEITETKVTDEGLRQLEQIPALETLFLPSSITDKGLDLVGKSGNLRTLDISESQVTDCGLAHLKGLSRLQELYAAGCGINGQGLKHLGNLDYLKKLNVSHTRISDDGLECVCSLSGLEELYLNDLKITDRGLPKLVCLPNLRTVDLARTTVTWRGSRRLREQSQG